MSTSCRARTIKLPPSREATAYHEAGHALLYEAHYLGVESATIVPTADTLGMVTMRDFTGSALLSGAMATFEADVVRFIASSRIRIALAGWEAEKMHRGVRFGLGLDPDFLKAIDYAEVAWSEDAGDAVMQRERRWTRRYLHAHWRHVEAVAALLLRRNTVDGDKVRDALDAVGPYTKVDAQRLTPRR
jgi:hypothetical protein